MKKIGLIVMAMALVMTFSQCKKDDKITPTNEGEKVLVTLKIGSNSNSRVVVTPETGEVTFENGDVIHVASNGVYVGTLAYDSDLSMFSGNITQPTEGEKLHFYFFGNQTPEFNAENTECSVIISDQTTKLPVISYNTSRESYQVGKTDYNATLLNKCALVKFNVTTSSTVATCITGFNNKVIVDFSENTLTNSKENNGVITLPAGNGEKWAILLPQDALGAGAEGSAYSVNSEYSGTRGAVPAIANNSYLADGIEVEVSGHYIDLGLPSGTLWATCNVGADTPEGYGDHFAWGETKPKTVYNWSTYQYCNGSENKLTKYCNNSSYGYNGFTDNLTTLLPEDDAATVNWGEDWRMPTEEEWQELYNNTTVTMIQYAGGGRVLHFTAPNGNCLFLPGAGYIMDNINYGGPDNNYWSSSLYTENSNYAWMYSYHQIWVQKSNSNRYRYRGLSVRAVRSVRNN